MVSLSIFTIVMLLSVGAITAVLDANSKNKNRKIAIDNLNFVVESMSRSIRFGTKYHCGGGDVTIPADCPLGSYIFSHISPEGQRIIYNVSGGAIVKSVDYGSYYNLTSPNEITIDTISYRVFGSASYSSGDYLQPQVIINISGSVGSNIETRTTFNLQNTVSQRRLDI
jgi:hypothetical protein